MGRYEFLGSFPGTYEERPIPHIHFKVRKYLFRDNFYSEMMRWRPRASRARPSSASSTSETRSRPAIRTTSGLGAPSLEQWRQSTGRTLSFVMEAVRSPSISDWISKIKINIFCSVKHLFASSRTVKIFCQVDWVSWVLGGVVRC